MSVGRAQVRSCIASPGAPLRGEIAVPGDKSVSHRAVMLGAIADGVTRIEGFLEGEDTRATAAIFSRLGVRIETPSPSRRVVQGVGVDGLKAAEGALDCGNAGTGMRLLAVTSLLDDASITLEPADLVENPDQLPSYAAWARFYERQDLLARLCEHLGWTLSIQSAPGRGTISRLRLSR